MWNRSNTALSIYEGHERWPVQKRMWIQTEETDRTKIITALKVRPSNQASKQIDVKKTMATLLIQSILRLLFM